MAQRKHTHVWLAWVLAISGAAFGQAPPAAPLEPMSADQAFEQLPRWNESDSRKAVLAAQAAVYRATAGAEERAAMTRRLVAILADSSATPAARSLVCGWLPLVAVDDESAVTALVACLDRDQSFESAAHALARVGGPAAGAALRAALGRLQDKQRVCVIQALGEARDQQAVEPLARLLSDQASATADAAAWALGAIGSHAAADVLLERPLPPGPAVLDALLRCAEAARARDDNAAATRIYERLAARELPGATRLTALVGLNTLAPDAVKPRLIEALDDEDDILARGALDLLVDRFQAARISPACRRVLLPNYLTRADGTLRPHVVDLLASVADDTVIERFVDLLKDPRNKAPAAQALVRILSEQATRDLNLSMAVLAKLRGSDLPVAMLEPLRPLERLVERVVGNAPRDYWLRAYLDCGTVTEAGSPARARIRQLTGAGHTWPGAEAFGPIGSVTYDPKEVLFELSNLEPDREYLLGFTWWDFDANGRIQSVRFGSGNRERWTTVLPPGPAQAVYQDKSTWAQVYLPIPQELAREPKVLVSFHRDGGPSNAVVSEIWLLERPRGEGRTNKRVAIVTGDEYPGHLWRETAPEMAAILRDDPRLEVTIIETPMILASPLLSYYDAVVLNYNNFNQRPDGGEPVWSGLRTFVESGHGLVMMHFACGAFGEWKDFVKLAGRVYDPALPPHDPYGPFGVTIVDRQHPITEGMSDFRTTDELYTCLAGTAPLRLLAQAVSVVDQKPYPMGFVVEPGKGRVFHSPLGHDVRALKPEGVRELYRRAAAWSAGLSPATRPGS